MFTLGLTKQDLWGLEAVIVYYSKLYFCQNDSPMGESFCQKNKLLQYSMTLLQGPKDAVLPTIVYILEQGFFITSGKKST